MEKKVLLATVYYQLNYGSVLQAYATQKIIDELGIQNQTINCKIINEQVKKKKIVYYLKHIYQKDVFMGQIKRYNLKLIKKVNGKFRKKILQREAVFEEFVNNQFKLTKPVKYKELGKLCENAWAVLVGSDQLWLPSNIEANYFTLAFVPKKIKKISYATSFGLSELPKIQGEKAKLYLDSFSCISVREESGVSIAKSLTNKEVHLVCDPTLLITNEQWQEIIPQEPIVKEKYIFCYFLGSNKAHREWAQLLSKKTGYKIVSLLHLDEYTKRDEEFTDVALYDINPFEFINLIKYAEYICTDSFHGTIFSIQNSKKFFVFKRFTNLNRASTNSRLDTLLKMFELQNRIIDSKVEPEMAIEMDIDYKKINGLMNKLRTHSISFLQKAFEIL